MEEKSSWLKIVAVKNRNKTGEKLILGVICPTKKNLCDALFVTYW